MVIVLQKKNSITLTQTYLRFDFMYTICYNQCFFYFRCAINMYCLWASENCRWSEQYDPDFTR